MALLAHTIKGSTDGETVTSDPIDTTGADFIRVTVSGFDSGLVVSDSYGNTWAVGTDIGVGLFAAVKYVYVLSPTCGAGHTFTCTPGGSGKRPSIAVSAWSGATAFHDHGTINSSTVTSYETETLTPSVAGELLFSDLSAENTDTVTIDADWTILGQIPYSVGLHAALAHAYCFAPSTSPIDADWAWTTSTASKGALISAFDYTEPPVELETIFIFGENTSSNADRTMTLGLDGETNLATEPGKFKVFGRGEFTGDLIVIDPVEPQDAVPKHYCDANSGGSLETIIHSIVTAGGEVVVGSDGYVVFET